MFFSVWFSFYLGDRKLKIWAKRGNIKVRISVYGSDGMINILFSIIGGIAITLLTAFIPLRSLMGATHYGFPLAWRIRLVLAPQYNPWRMNITNLVMDVVIWSVIVGIAIFIIRRR